MVSRGGDEGRVSLPPLYRRVGRSSYFRTLLGSHESIGTAARALVTGIPAGARDLRES